MHLYGQLILWFGPTLTYLVGFVLPQIGGDDGDGTGQRVVAPYKTPAGETIEVYTAATDAWTGNWTMGSNGTAKTLPSPRSALGSIVLDGILYVIGGRDGGGAVNRVDAFNFSNSSWSVGPALRNARWKPAVAAIDGRIFVMGGATSHSNPPQPPSSTPLASIEIYDPATHDVCVDMSAQCWLEGAAMPVPRVYGEVVAVAIGGQHHHRGRNIQGAPHRFATKAVGER